MWTNERVRLPFSSKTHRKSSPIISPLKLQKYFEFPFRTIAQNRILGKPGTGIVRLRAAPDRYKSSHLPSNCPVFIAT
jgi:hypothetical protein